MGVFIPEKVSQCFDSFEKTVMDHQLQDVHVLICLCLNISDGDVTSPYV